MPIYCYLDELLLLVYSILCLQILGACRVRRNSGRYATKSNAVCLLVFMQLSMSLTFMSGSNSHGVVK